ncbi:glycoside hydrolase family 78 protein [Terrimonas sp. NA20]|uniref:alpha-L-rhamnosidase n=1 Tax=Terrimonas ginsenosidimutans TaxID=2908004 RepID=A0ABS9KPT2_9BACT|nr:alpha-L-rhamnosidase [Terrimonas ginsenosidimutans]MCG2614322.1 glycoside hydrolase family 78 protein [Terrimonas ginsenosidimutans]
MRNIIPAIAFAILSILLSSPFILAQTGSKELRCEHLVTPLGVDKDQPRLSWQMNDPAQGATQSAYQVIISTDTALPESGSKNHWNSGKISSTTHLITYNGKRLAPFTRYHWKVKIWDKNGKQLPSSPVSWFETGMMDMANWKGTWISDGGSINTLPAPYFRKQFTAKKKISSARAYIAVAGLYELYINGQKTGDHRLDPMYTRFDRRNMYVSHDITGLLNNGENAVGVILGNGWYNHQSLAVWNFERAPWRQRPTFCMDIRITYEDGTTETVSTDGSWKSHASPIIFNSIYTGEHYDSRLEIPDWSTTRYNDSTWRGSGLRAAPSQHVVSQLMAPIKNVDEIKPTSFTRFSDTSYLFDLGRNIAGVIKIKLKGKSGTTVRIIHGERLYKQGAARKVPAQHVDLSNIDVYHRPKDNSDPFQTDIVILNGSGAVEFMPKFNYKGFQYVEIISDKPVKIEKNDLVAYFMHSDVSATGQISSSNTLLNKIWEATNNSYLSNLFGYPTDCPQREKNGWTGDGHFAIESGLFNFDGISVYEKWMADHRDEQQPNGVLPDIIPTGGWGYGTANGTDWTSTIAIIPWNLYLFYGDLTPLKDNYENIKRYVNYVEGISPTGFTTFGRGDWVPVKSTSSLELTSSIYFYVDANILAKTAKLLNRKDDQQRYTALAEKIRKAINEKYFDRDKKIYGNGVQTELSMALYWKIVPEEFRAAVADNLAKRVMQDNLHLDVGVLGAKAILNALSENGKTDIAYQLAVQSTYPSWGWWIQNGATTLYENWDIDAARDISLNHMMFGEIGGWFYKGLGGIHPDEAAPGFKHVKLEPGFPTGLENFSASYRSPYGKIISSWKRTAGNIVYEVTVPANSSASVQLPPVIKKAKLNGKEIVVEKSIRLTAGSYTLTFAE